MMLMISNVFVYIKSKFPEERQAYSYVGKNVPGERPNNDKTYSLIRSGIFGKAKRGAALHSPPSKDLNVSTTKEAFCQAILLFLHPLGFTSMMAQMSKAQDILPHINKSICS